MFQSSELEDTSKVMRPNLPLVLGGKGFQAWRGFGSCAQSEDLSDLLPGLPGHPRPERQTAWGGRVALASSLQ